MESEAYEQASIESSYRTNNGKNIRESSSLPGFLYLFLSLVHPMDRCPGHKSKKKQFLFSRLSGIPSSLVLY